MLWGREREFYQGTIGKIKDKLKIGEEKEEDFKYPGMRIENEERKINLDQQEYISKMKILKKEQFNGKRNRSGKTMALFRSEKGKLNWLSQLSRPE